MAAFLAASDKPDGEYSSLRTIPARLVQRPLRSLVPVTRVADIPLLVEYLIDRFGKRAGKKFRTIDRKSLRVFQAYGWQGNVRELQNVIERAVILSEGETFAVDETWLRRELPASLKRRGTPKRHPCEAGKGND
jgi:DNA-binding NtrC family response regulator